MSKHGIIPDHIRSLRGSFKLKPGEKPATQQLLDDRAEDLRLEEAKWTRFEKQMQRKPKRAHPHESQC